MLKILKVRLQQYMNCELQDVQPGFRKSRGIRDQIANNHWIIDKAREFHKSIYICFIDYTIAFDCVDHKKLENSSRMSIPDHFTCLLRNLYAGQEATVRTSHATTDLFQIGKGECQGSVLSPCLLTYMQSTSCKCWVDKAQAEAKIARRNINNFRYEDDTTLMAESKEELKSLLTKVKV